MKKAIFILCLSCFLLGCGEFETSCYKFHTVDKVYGRMSGALIDYSESDISICGLTEAEAKETARQMETGGNITEGIYIFTATVTYEKQ